MNTHDKIELPPLPEWLGWPVTVSEMSASEVKEAMQDYARAAIEADRKHRGEPVGYIMPTALKQLKAGGNAVVGGVSQGCDVPIYTAPQPAEPSRGEPVAMTLGQKAVAAELLECFKAWEPMVCVLGNVRARDGADLMQAILNATPQPAEPCVSSVSDKTACGSANGDGDSQPAEPVKHKRRYAQGTALGEFGIIPMCDQVDDEPVKVPSDDEIMSVVRYSTVGSAAIQDDEWCAFARAILARYGNAAQPIDPANDDPTPEEEEAWQQMEKTND